MFRHLIICVVLLFLCQFVLAQAPSAPGKPLPPGPMQAKVKAACTQCHDASRITESLGASIPDEDREGILTYLTKNFGPKNGGKTGKKADSAAY